VGRPAHRQHLYPCRRLVAATGLKLSAVLVWLGLVRWLFGSWLGWWAVDRTRLTWDAGDLVEASSHAIGFDRWVAELRVVRVAR